MAMKRKLIVLTAVSSIAFVLIAGIYLAHLTEIRTYTYPLSVENKTFIVTVETNWNGERKPTVSLTNSSDIYSHGVILYFLGGSKQTVSYNITVPASLINGNISLVWKYYLQNPDRYILSSNGTHNSLQMTFDYDPYFSGRGFFEILGSEGDW